MKTVGQIYSELKTDPNGQLIRDAISNLNFDFEKNLSAEMLGQIADYICDQGYCNHHYLHSTQEGG